MDKIKSKLIEFMNKDDKRKSLVIWGVIIFVLFILMPLSYAIYKKTINENSLLSLATWNVVLNQTNEENHISVLPDPNGTVASYTLNVTSQSEVDIVYSIAIDGLPTGVSVSIDNGTSFTAEVNHKVTFSNVDTIAHNAQNKTKTKTVLFKAANGTTPVNNQEVSINVIAKQVVQSN